MVSKSVVRGGVLIVLALGIVTMLAAPVAASNHCSEDTNEWPCDDEADRPPLYDGPDLEVGENVSDVGGNVTDALGSLPDVGDLLPLPQ